MVTGKRLSLSRRIPRVLSPECLQRGVVALENVAFSFSNIGYRFRKQAPRSQIAFTIAAVLPHVPGTPGRRVPRLSMIVSDPQPAIRQGLAVCCGGPWPVKHLPQTIFTAVKTWIFACSLFDALNECDCLGYAHRASGIVTVFFEIQHEQHTPSLFRIPRADRWPCRCNSIDKMVSLSDRAGCVAEMVSSP